MPLEFKIIYREKVSSTNDLALELLTEHRAAEGTVIYASEQQKGRGQRGNLWSSEAGKNLTMSIILKPNFLPAEKQFYISKVISLAIIDLLKDYTGNISIKWPNDIYVKDDKIAGILIENAVTGTSLSSSIAGIGLNLNQLSFNNNIENPVSLGLLTGNYYNVENILELLCAFITERYDQLRTGDLRSIDTDYHRYLYLLDKPADYITDKGVIRASIKKVNKYGQLVVDKELSGTETYSFKEIGFILPGSSTY